MMQKLWGDNYFDAEKKVWTTNGTSASGKELKRTFVQFVMEPIIRMCRSIIDGDKPQMEKMMKAMNIVLKKEEQDFMGK
jgi:elongation factor 2